MISKNNYHYTLIASLMILVAFLGLTFRKNKKTHYYVPIGVTGIYLVVEREYNRKNNREDTLNKIKNFQENK